MASTLTERLRLASAEVAELKTALRQKESDYQDLQRDCRFHAIKAAEFADVIDARSQDEMVQQLKVKTVQNAELTVQVQDLRSLLEASAQRMDILKQHKQAHQHMLLEMTSVIRALQKLPITLDPTTTPHSANPREKPLLEVKQKVEVLEKRWKGLIEESYTLRQEIEFKENKIQALESLFHNLNTNRIDELGENNNPDTKQLTVSTNPSGYAYLGESNNPSPLNLGSEGKEANGDPGRTFMSRNEVCPDEDGNAEILMYTYLHPDDVSQVSSLATVGASRADKEIQKMTEKYNELKEENQRKTFELDVVNKKYNDLKTEHEHAREKISSLETQVIETTNNYESANKKQELREGLLRDLISQYKELQKEYDAAMKNVSFLQEKLETSSGASAGPEDERMTGSSDHNDSSASGHGRAFSSKPIKKSLPKTNTRGEVEAVSTFELSDTSSTESHSVSTTGAQAKDALSIEGLEFEFEQSSDDHKRLEDECFRLEHEYDNAVARMTNFEEELKMAKKQAASANQKCLVYAGDMLNLTEQHTLLEEQHSSFMERTEVLEKELDAARQEADAAQRKQKQRDKHLWQVIKQYKDLAEKNNSTEAKIASVQEELAFSKQHSNRRDLVHEYRMMEHEYEDAKAKIDTLERDLKSAKAEVIRSKEDAKCTRKRLAGCHFHYKKLQHSYDEARSKISDGDRELMTSRTALSAMKA